MPIPLATHRNILFTISKYETLTQDSMVEGTGVLGDGSPIAESRQSFVGSGPKAKSSLDSSELIFFVNVLAVYCVVIRHINSDDDHANLIH